MIAVATLAVIMANFAGQPVEINVTPGPGAWNGSALVGQPRLWIGEQAYQDAQHGHVFGLFTLLHEVGHTTGIADEHQADCYALHHLKAALRYWHLKPRALRDRLADAATMNRATLAMRQGYGCLR